jgi:DNA-binding transcriptional ArsR family regulator
VSVSSRFSPRSLEPAQLEHLIVGREQLLVRLQEVVTGAVVSGQARFDLVLGPRGAGKSHVLGVLEGRLRASPQLSGRTVVIAPPEAIHPLSLVQLLAQLLRELPDDPEIGPTSDAVRSLQRQRDGDQERRAVALIRGRLAGRSLIILLENLDELFVALGRDGQQRLRNILQTERCWSIVATSRSLSPAFTKYEAPFHGTFNLHRLEPLSPEQCRDMLATLADAHGKAQLAALLRTPKGLARVRGLHHLLGGNPRAMACLFRQLDEQRLDHFELALADLADELEPHFRAQVSRISPMQRAIMELLAESWRPLTVTELAERSFSAQASTSSALRHLRSEALVQTLEVGRERYYELSDPLLRLAWANERPRDEIAALARAIRWWHAQDNERDSGVPEYRIPAKQARSQWSAHDGPDGDFVTSTAISAGDAPSVAADLPRAIRVAWHQRRLGELFAPHVSLDPLNAVLPAPVRRLIAAAIAAARDEPVQSPTVDDVVALRSTLLDSQQLGLALCGVLLEVSCKWAELSTESSMFAVVGDDLRQLQTCLLLGLYSWLASRRPLEPLRQLAAQVFDAGVAPQVLASAGPREAVARLSEPERAIIRAILQLNGDREGLATLALDAER